MDTPKSAVVELVYNALGNTVGTMQHQYNLSNLEIEFALTKVMHDVQTARLIEASNNTMQLTQKLNALEEANKHDKPDN